MTPATDPADGKGPGYALLWGGVAFLFGAMILAAGLLGYCSWPVVAALEAFIWGGFGALMATAQWAAKP